MSENSEKFRGAIAYQYDEAMDNLMCKTLRQSASDRLSQERGLGRAVELGCGTGYFTEENMRIVFDDYLGKWNYNLRFIRAL